MEARPLKFYFCAQSRDPARGFRLRQIPFERLRFVGLLCEVFEQHCLFNSHEFDRCGGEVRISPAHLNPERAALSFGNLCHLSKYHDYGAGATEENGSYNSEPSPRSSWSASALPLFSIASI